MATISGAISWTYRALNPTPARLFRLLGAHPGAQILHGAAAAMLGDHAAATTRALDELVRMHLLEHVDENRYSMHDLVLLYTRQSLTNNSDDVSEVNEAFGRAMAWYLGAARAADVTIAPWQVRPGLDAPNSSSFPTPTTALIWCDKNLDVLLAVSRAASQARSHVSWELPLVLAGYFKLRRPRGAWIDMHLAGRDTAQHCGNRDAEGWILNNLATAYYHVGESDLAQRYFRQAIAVRADLGDQWGVAWSQLGLGYTLWHADDTVTARTLFEEALPVLEEAGDSRGQGLVRVGMAGAAGRHNPEHSLRELHRALGLFEATNDANGKGMALHELGVLSHRTGALADANDFLNQALELRKDHGDTAGTGETLKAMADTLSSLGHRAASTKARRDAIVILREFQQPPRPWSADVGGPPTLLSTSKRRRHGAQPDEGLG